MFEFFNRCRNVVSDKVNAIKSVVTAPEGSRSVKMIPYLVEGEECVMKLANNTLTQVNDLPESNNPDNNNPTDSKSLATKHNAIEKATTQTKQINSVYDDSNGINYTFGTKKDGWTSVSEEGSELNKMLVRRADDYCYDSSNGKCYLLERAGDNWEYVTSYDAH